MTPPPPGPQATAERHAALPLLDRLLPEQWPCCGQAFADGGPARLAVHRNGHRLELAPIEQHQGDSAMTDHQSTPGIDSRRPTIEVYPYSTSDPNTTRPHEFGFRLKAENGEVVMHGEGYTEASAAEAMARKIVVDHAYDDARVVLLNWSGQVVSESERQHLTDGSRWWCDPQVVIVPAALPEVWEDGDGGVPGGGRGGDPMTAITSPLIAGRWTVSLMFAWFDLWVGVYVDRQNQRAYIFPLPCLGLVITRKEPPLVPGEETDTRAGHSDTGGAPASKFPPSGIASAAWAEALAEHPTDAPDSAELCRTFVCNTVLHAFNPPDDDVGYESIITDAIEAAASFIEAQPCACGPEPWEDGPCERCAVLGRVADEVLAR